MSDLIGKPINPREALGALVSLVRVPIRSGHVAYLDGWRGICILLVLVGHCASSLGTLGSAGVEFFFVLSGTLMADLLVFKRQEVGLFLRRRVARVFPALAVYVGLIGLAVNISLWRQGQTLRLASPLAALFYFHNYLPHDSVLQVFEHTWSLAVEEHSYLLLVGIVLAARRRPRLAATIALAVSVLAVANAYRLLALPYAGGQYILWRSDVRVASVLLSFGMCILLRRLSPKRLSGWATVVAAAAALFGLSNPAISPIGLAMSTLLAAYAVNSLAFCGARLRAALATPTLVWFGTLSFSIYLWQQLFYFLFKAGSPPLACIAMTIACALMSFKLVENPARDFLNTHWGHKGRDRVAQPLSTEFTISR